MDPERLDDGPARLAGRVVKLLARDPRVELVYLFGSALDSPTPRDLDLGVWADPAFSIEELTTRRADLVPTIRYSIDLVSLNAASIVLAYEVVEHGRCLFARDPDIETAFVTRARSRFWDFMPYREEQWRLTGIRVEERLSGSET